MRCIRCSYPTRTLSRRSAPSGPQLDRHRSEPSTVGHSRPRRAARRSCSSRTSTRKSKDSNESSRPVGSDTDSAFRLGKARCRCRTSAGGLGLWSVRPRFYERKVSFARTNKCPCSSSRRNPPTRAFGKMSSGRWPCRATSLLRPSHQRVLLIPTGEATLSSRWSKDRSGSGKALLPSCS